MFVELLRSKATTSPDVVHARSRNVSLCAIDYEIYFELTVQIFYN